MLLDFPVELLVELFDLLVAPVDIELRSSKTILQLVETLVTV